MSKKRNRVRLSGSIVAVLPSVDHNTWATAETGDTIDVVLNSDVEPELLEQPIVSAVDSA